MAFISVSNLQEYKAKSDALYGARISVNGTTVTLQDKSGNTLSSGTVVVPTYSNATQSVSGLMSSDDKTKLDGVAVGATKVTSSTNGKIAINGTATTVYTHPTYTAQDQGLYTIQVDGTGHVVAVTPVVKADITALGIPAQDTTYSTATTSANGLMTSAMVTKLNGVSTGAQVNVLESVKINGTALGISSKSVNIDLSGYALKSDISQAINYKGSVTTYALLPTTAKTGDMYNVETADEAHGISAGENVIWNGSKWDALGSVFSITEATDAQIDALFV